MGRLSSLQCTRIVETYLSRGFLIVSLFGAYIIRGLYTFCRLCQVEIARRTAAYTKVVCELRMNLIGGDDMTDPPNPSREIGHTLLPLPLPSDAVLAEFRQLIQPHITELLV